MPSRALAKLGLRPLVAATLALVFVACRMAANDGIETPGGRGGAAPLSTGGATSLGGVGGAGATGGTAPLSTGGTVQPSSCGEHSRPDPYMSPDTRGAASESKSFEGPAIVERSTDDELVLYFVPTGESAAAGATPGTPAHAQIGSDRPLPHLPPGAKVWLSKSPAGNRNISRALMYGPEPSELWIDDREGGTLLLGTAYLAGAPRQLAVSPQVGYCVAPDPNSCNPNGQVTYGMVEVSGDETVSIRDGETGVVSIAGISYEVTVSAQNVTTSAGARTCVDYHAWSGITLDIVAKDWAKATALLELGDAPACVEGNDPLRRLSMSWTGVNNSTTFEGPVVYTGRNWAGSPQFRVDALTRADGGPAGLYLTGSPAVLPELTVGGEYWLSFPDSSSNALWDRQQQELLLATFWGSSPPSEAQAASIADILGVPVTTERRCDYTGPEDWLDDVVFATTPPVRVKSGSAAVLTLGGKDYNVWARAGRGSASFVIYPR